MDFQIYEKIFREKDVLKRYKIMKSIAYIKINENNNLDNYFLSLFNEIFQIISLNSSENFRNNKFILIVMLITQALKVKIKLVSIVQKKDCDMIQEIFKFFWVHFSDECSQNYFARKTIVKLMSYFQEQTMIILTNTYCLENLLKLIFSEKTGEILNEEYTLEKRIEVFKGLLEFAKDFFLFSNKKKIESLHMKEICKKILKNLTLILLWNQETQCKYLEKSTKEYKFDFFKDLCDEIRKEILKLFSELINNSTLNLEDVKDDIKAQFILSKCFCENNKNSSLTPKCEEFLRVVNCLWNKTDFNFNEEFFNLKWFWIDILEGLSSINSQTNKISFNLLARVANQIISFNSNEKEKLSNYSNFYNILKIFLDLYLTLDSYASHLIKAIYKSFLTILKYKQEDFCNINDDIPFIKFVDSSVLSLILLKKAIRHDNLAVRRYCIKSFLKFKMHIKNFETFIYSSLFEILNTSVFYKDASYEQDSKFYPILTNYFVGIFSQLVEKEFNQNLKNFLISIEKYTTYCHPLIALFNVFEKLGEKKIGFLGISELLILDKIIKINYESLQYRKKIQLFNCIMHLIINFIDLSQLNFSFFRILIEILPPELFKFKSFLHTSSEFPIVEMIKNQNINNDFLNCNFLNREKMFVWLMTLPKNIEVLSNLYSIGNSCQKNIDDFNFIVKYLSIYGKSNDFFSKNENEKIFHKPNNEILKTDFFNFLEPFFNELSLYQDSYKSTKNCILIFKKLNDLVSFPLEEGSLEYQKYILSQLNIYAGEILPYLNLKIADESEDLEEFYENKDMLVIFIKNIFSIATKNYNSMSKLLQNLIKFSAILMEKIEKISTAKKEFYPILVLSFFNAILTAIIEQNETNFIENFIEIKTKGLNLVILMINQTKFQDRFFNNIKNIFIYNYFILLSNDNAIVSDVLFKETVGSFLTNVFDLCDQCNIDSYNIFFKFLEKLYIPYILNKINDTKSNESILEIMKFINVCRDNLVGNCRWTFRYKEVNNLMSFILNEKFFFNDNLIKSKIFNKFIIETWEIGSKYWLIQRSVIDHLFKIFYYYPQIMNNFEDVFVYLLKSKENRGYDANLLFYLDEFYIPKINEMKKKMPDNSDFYGSYPRYLMLSLLEENLKKLLKFINDENIENHSNIIKNLSNFYFNMILKLLEINFLGKMKAICIPYTKEYKEKLYVWQALCALQRIISKGVSRQLNKIGFDSFGIMQKIQDSTWKILQMNNLPTIRQYIEIFALNYLYNFTDENISVIVEHLKDANLKAQFSISIIFLIGYFLSKAPYQKDFNEIFLKYFPYTMSNLAYLRAIAQYFSFGFMKKYNFGEENQIYQEFLDYFVSHKDSIFLKDKFDIMLLNYEKVLNDFELDFLFTTKFDDFGELINVSAVEQLKQILISFIQDLKFEEKVPPKINELWRIEADELVRKYALETEENSKNTNFQRKIKNIIEENFDTFDKLREVKKAPKGELIVVASLIDKIPNLANLTRTCEIFGVSELIVSNKDILNDEAFKNISVTAEKWIQMVEIKQTELMSFLMLKKNIGFKLIGLEQTSESVSIENFEFPNRCLLLLGKERTGIPIDYIDILDFCVEIPQFGTIRSLNVHISAVICIWEYVKQKFIEAKH